MLTKPFLFYYLKEFFAKKGCEKKSKVRNQVEHPFGYIKGKLDYRKAVTKNIQRNTLRFDFNCILYNIFRANYLLLKVG